MRSLRTLMESLSGFVMVGFLGGWIGGGGPQAACHGARGRPAAAARVRAPIHAQARPDARGRPRQVVQSAARRVLARQFLDRRRVLTGPRAVQAASRPRPAGAEESRPALSRRCRMLRFALGLACLALLAAPTAAQIARAEHTHLLAFSLEAGGGSAAALDTAGYVALGDLSGGQLASHHYRAS